MLELHRCMHTMHISRIMCAVTQRQPWPQHHPNDLHSGLTAFWADGILESV
jgi:hypothetical protein